MLTTHDMDDVEALCPRVILIDGGTLVFDDSIEALRNRYARERTVSVTPGRGIDPAGIAVPGAQTRVVDGKAELTFDPTRLTTPEVIAQATASGEYDLVLLRPAASDDGGVPPGLARLPEPRIIGRAKHDGLAADGTRPLEEHCYAPSNAAAPAPC